MAILLESGKIKKRINSQYEEVTYEMLQLDKSYLDQVMNLQQIAFDSLSAPELYQLQPRKFMKNQFGKEGLTIGVVVESQLIAFQVLHFPATASTPFDVSENLGIDLKMSKDELTKVAHLETNALHPAYLGNLLSAKMTMHLLKLAHDLHYYHVCATVSPKNYSIVISFLEAGQGTVIRALKEKYEGKLRYIFYRNLKNPLLPDFHEKISIDIMDIKKQQNILERGFWGYKIRKTGEGIEIVYGK